VILPESSYLQGIASTGIDWAQYIALREATPSTALDNVDLDSCAVISTAALIMPQLTRTKANTAFSVK
jgi:hypothetical protein